MRLSPALVDHQTEQGKKFLAAGNVKEAEKCFRCAVLNKAKVAEPYLLLYELTGHQNVELLHQSLAAQPTKQAYYLLLEHYADSASFFKLESTFEAVHDFFVRTNYELQPEDAEKLTAVSRKIAAYVTNNGKECIQIDKFIDAESIQAFCNKLECICVLVTGQEAVTGEYATFYDRLLASLESSERNKQAAKNLDFRLVVKDDYIVDLGRLAAFFRSASIVRLDLSDDQDVYVRDYSTDSFSSRTNLGFKSGPNHVFLEVMRLFKQYNTTLLLECDCYLGSDWIARLVDYAQHSGNFWIAGATYDGVQFAEFGSVPIQHLNGGTSMYATGNSSFQAFILFCKWLLPFYVKELPAIPYDCLITKIIQDQYTSDLVNRRFWIFIYRNYVKTNLILNYSPVQDKFTCERSIQRLHNYAVLHKKTTEENSVPVFVHFPKCVGTYVDVGYLVPNLQRKHQNEFRKGYAVQLALKNEQGYTQLKVVAALSDYRIIGAYTDFTKMPFEQFLDLHQKGKILKILGVTLTSHSSFQRDLKFIQKLSDSKLSLITVLRNPIRRYESLFYYVTDKVNALELPQAIDGNTFAEFVQSPKFEDNWIVRKINDIVLTDTPVTEKHFQYAVNWLENCSIVGCATHLDQFLTALRQRYGFLLNVMPYGVDLRDHNRNMVSVRKVITPAIRRLFEEKCQYDIKLYEHFKP